MIFLVCFLVNSIHYMLLFFSFLFLAIKLPVKNICFIFSIWFGFKLSGQQAINKNNIFASSQFWVLQIWVLNEIRFLFTWNIYNFWTYFLFCSNNMKNGSSKQFSIHHALCTNTYWKIHIVFERTGEDFQLWCFWNR